MGFRLIEIEMPTDYTPEELEKKLCKRARVNNCSYVIEKQSLDARDKRKIHWKIKAGVSSPEIKMGDIVEFEEPLVIPDLSNRLKYSDMGNAGRAVVVGSGPAGMFAAYVLAKSGLDVTLIEQGRDVDTRAKDIHEFEKTGQLDESSNYAYGEGGAGTFSDGKLTSRSKHIPKEKKFIFDLYAKAGAPEEIKYLAHPHIGSDNLRIVARNIRKEFEDMGGKFLFNTKMTGIETEQDRVLAIETDKGRFEAGYFIIAPGHSSFQTYAMLIRSGVRFEVKPFAIGCRAEHPQELINLSQWGQKSVPGLKAAEYKLTYSHSDYYPVYSFCMCPGGKVVPATPEKGLSIVNGMSYYKRNSPWANSGIVAGINFNEMFGRELDALEAIEKLREIETVFYDFSGSYAVPAIKIKDYIEKKNTVSFSKTSYPFDLIPADYSGLLPAKVNASMLEGMKDFCKKIRGYEEGIMMGLESKTSSPIRSVRDESGKYAGFDNLYISGEGSGHSGGIVSSAADGIKAALSIIENIFRF